MLKRTPRHDEVLWLSEGAVGGGENPAVAEPEPAPELSAPEPPKQQIEEPIPVPPEQKTAALTLSAEPYNLTRADVSAELRALRGRRLNTAEELVGARARSTRG